MFPFFKGRMDFSGEEEQHKVIHTALDAMLALLGDPVTFDAAQVIALMGTLKKPLVCYGADWVETVVLMSL